MWPGFDRCGSRNETNPSQQETLPEVEHISTIAGSLGSIGTISQCGNEPVYDTDHTELNSDYDEAEYRRELLKDKWKQLFDMVIMKVLISLTILLFVAVVVKSQDTTLAPGTTPIPEPTSPPTRKPCRRPGQPRPPSRRGPTGPPPPPPPPIPPRRLGIVDSPDLIQRILSELPNILNNIRNDIQGRKPTRN